MILNMVILIVKMLGIDRKYLEGLQSSVNLDCNSSPSTRLGTTLRLYKDTQTVDEFLTVQFNHTSITFIYRILTLVYNI